ncbi:MAG TPA: hypothetical protein ENK60_07885 [Anaerolineae bacterium]|nr:hypothetical protein [Anaerolineae bacterium]
MSGDFWTGFWSGLALAAIIGWLAVMAGPYVQRIAQPFRPQVVVHKTSKTPCRVILEAIAAFLVTFTLTLIIVLLIFYLLR